MPSPFARESDHAIDSAPHSQLIVGGVFVAGCGNEHGAGRIEFGEQQLHCATYPQLA